MKGPCVVESHQSSFSCVDSGYEGTFSNLQGPLCVDHKRPFLPEDLQGPSDFRSRGSRYEFVVGGAFYKAHEIGDGGGEVHFTVREDDSSAFVDERWGRGGTRMGRGGKGLPSKVPFFSFNTSLVSFVLL